jgi:DNA modification methylase
MSMAINEGDQIVKLLQADLGFHASGGGHARHGFHAFAAKFPPQLPAWFIEGLTEPGDVVFDPFLGSGTTVLEAMRLNRRAMGIDIDPLAILMSRVKTFPLNPVQVSVMGKAIVNQARVDQLHPEHLLQHLDSRFFDKKDRDFIEYWFLPSTILELEALMEGIEAIEEDMYREFFLVVFSSIIVTKSGGVSMARDLAHSRPHRVADKVPKSAIESFEKRLAKLNPALNPVDAAFSPWIQQGDIRQIHLAENSVDLIVTSPPYANAIDYVRANKFSLVWMGNSLRDLAVLRSNYIGTETHKLFDWDIFPVPVQEILNALSLKDRDKSGLLGRYFSDMRQAMARMYQTLKPGKYALIVVGTSTMRGLDVETPQSLALIAQDLGYQLYDVVERSLDRNRRMMPTRWGAKQTSIEQRMHSEHVIALMKV